MSLEYPCVYYDNEKCQKFTDDKFTSWCVLGPCGEQMLSNADRIRAMSDEAFAVWLVKKTVYQESAFSQPSYLNFLTGMDDTKEGAINGTIVWLKRPAKDGENDG